LSTCTIWKSTTHRKKNLDEFSKDKKNNKKKARENTTQMYGNPSVDQPPPFRPQPLDAPGTPSPSPLTATRIVPKAISLVATPPLPEANVSGGGGGDDSVGGGVASGVGARVSKTTATAMMLEKQNKIETVQQEERDILTLIVETIEQGIEVVKRQEVGIWLILAFVVILVFFVCGVVGHQVAVLDDV
jgi:hypothetical protein